MSPDLSLIVALTALLAIALLAFAALRAFAAWLDWKRVELAAGRGEVTGTMPATATRIEVADLKERIRKLEAIAAGVDL